MDPGNLVASVWKIKVNYLVLICDVCQHRRPQTWIFMKIPTCSKVSHCFLVDHLALESASPPGLFRARFGFHGMNADWFLETSFFSPILYCCFCCLLGYHDVVFQKVQNLSFQKSIWSMGLFPAVKKLYHFEIPIWYSYSPLDESIMCMLRLFM